MRVEAEMTKHYEPMTIEDLLDALDEMSADTTVEGLSDRFDSYRGYYKHVAVEPGDGVTAGALAAAFRNRLGETMTGYKGGEFEIHGDCYVFVAAYGYTGPMLVGFDNGEPVTCTEAWLW